MEHAEKCVELLKQFGLTADLQVLSAHRNPEGLREYVKKSEAKVFIAMAGLAAHLPGAVASLTTRPVIGVPIGAKLGGLDSLLSISMMPRGVPVACVAVDGSENAAILAAEILAVKDEDLKKKLEDYRNSIR